MSWPSGKVSDIGEVISGFAFKSEWFGFGDAKVIRIGDLQDGRVDLAGAETFDEDAHQVREQFKIRNGDILMALSGATVGKIAVADTSIEGAYLNQRVAVVRGKCPTNTAYLKYVFSGNLLQKLLINAGGAAQPNLSPKDLGDMEIPLPPLEEQKRIAAILDKADAIRRKRLQAIKLADDFLRSVFLEMFGDPVTNPKGWEVRPLISLCAEGFQNGAYFPPENYADDGVEMVHMSDAFYDTVQRGALRRVRCSSEDIKKYGLNENQLLISRRSLTYEGAAKPSLIPKSDEPLIFESSLIRISPSNDEILTRFLFQYLSTESVKEHHIRKYVTGATIKGISQKNLEKIFVYVPPLELQEEFSLVVSKVSRLIKTNMASSIVKYKLFDSLSQKAFAGMI